MKFSVVIPLYNKAPYIMCAIESVLVQTCADLEVIVVDDGSSDDGAKLVRSITDPRVRMISQANAGVSVARNCGIASARGEWVAFLDADDWYDPRYLSTLLMAQEVSPEADAVACDYLKVPHAAGKWPPRWFVPVCAPEVELIDNLPRRWIRGPSLSASSVAVRATRLAAMQPCFPPGEFYGEDLDFWFRLAERTPIAIVHTPLVAYRVALADSLSTQRNVVTMPPWIPRMQARALSGTMTKSQQKSALWFIAQIKVTLARRVVVSGSRIEGFRWLFRGWRAAMGTRWWLTAMMILMVPGSFVAKWEDWRGNRITQKTEAVSPGAKP
ncbi:MAG: glycosyltransferase family 2 protein [Burkholderiaceae bacterium]|nr:MAG: glycosyltransferase family 2 protein [Burkholderiaceae bacterium]